MNQLKSFDTRLEEQLASSKCIEILFINEVDRKYTSHMDLPEFVSSPKHARVTQTVLIPVRLGGFS